jgi:hypothetical protein
MGVKHDRETHDWLADAELRLLGLHDLVEKQGREDLRPALEEQRFDMIGVLTLSRRGQSDALSWLWTDH